MQSRTTPSIRSCDYVYEFNQLGRKSLLFLYRGTRPPVTMRELCQVRYEGSLHEVESGFTINTVLSVAPKLPRLLNAEEVTSSAYKSLFDQLSVQDRAQLHQIPLYKYNPKKAWQ